MEVALFKDVLVIFSLAIGVLLICQRLNLPTVVGFLLTGILAGPYGFGLISAIEEVEILAEIGVMLLLFTIGVEFSLKEFMRMKKSVVLGGSFQVILTFLVSFAIATRLGRPFNEAVFIGFFISLSSTAIVLKILQEKAEFDSPHGRMALAVLIFQDIAVVPMILFTPLLAGEGANLGHSLGFLALKGLGVFVLVAVSAKWIVPGLLYQIARSRSRELFLLSVLVMCFGVAWLTYLAGLSLALQHSALSRRLYQFIFRQHWDAPGPWLFDQTSRSGCSYLFSGHHFQNFHRQHCRTFPWLSSSHRYHSWSYTLPGGRILFHFGQGRC
jgi:CPA2 family monovalent cation:H+ antiporter-2